MSDSNGNGNGGCGCIGLIVTLIFLWFICFGFTWKNVKYDIKCSTANGVELTEEVKKVEDK